MLRNLKSINVLTAAAVFILTILTIAIQFGRHNGQATRSSSVHPSVFGEQARKQYGKSGQRDNVRGEWHKFCGSEAIDNACRARAKTSCRFILEGQHFSRHPEI